ncbi:hypothetical protein UFOVP223_23 [uncultured Caudovirales phage]|uniref:Uncharacterized protein n=1 Tax=uncultured Caudovirales phage TaxID=2100421 RepID=A0A6J5L3A1_9CAUD|nr:hypothetical protein UFOVP110_7 [uncultured Caudovirales phage]CAB5219062.1 hypothetical protein UFOVP223_23 [uncultured Caudovirales phage]
MHILVELDGVLRGPKDEPISTGIVMVGTLSVYNQLILMSKSSEAETKQWLDVNKVVDFDRIIDSSAGLPDEVLEERQIKYVRSRGPIDLFITNSPTLWAYAFDQGIPSVMFGVPSYTRVEFRPDAPKAVRAWNDIEEAIDKQNALRTNDARLTRTESLNFE